LLIAHSDNARGSPQGLWLSPDAVVYGYNDLPSERGSEISKECPLGEACQRRARQQKDPLVLGSDRRYAKRLRVAVRLKDATRGLLFLL
jgi:hypothetical protein